MLFPKVAITGRPLKFIEQTGMPGQDSIAIDELYIYDSSMSIAVIVSVTRSLFF